jgi:hypothetical protein
MSDAAVSRQTEQGFNGTDRIDPVQSGRLIEAMKDTAD